MNCFTRLAATATLALLAAVAGSSTALAADYPTKPVKWIVPYPPGGTTDVLARVIAVWLTEKMGQQFVIENKPGGGNNIGVEFVLNSPPDEQFLFLRRACGRAIDAGEAATVFLDVRPDFWRRVRGSVVHGGSSLS